jgi:hypothetical protein
MTRHIFCIYIHYSICNNLNIETAENWYSYRPMTAYEHENTTALCNQGIETGIDIVVSRTDVTIKGRTDNIYLQIDVTIPSNRNFFQKEAQIIEK